MAMSTINGEAGRRGFGTLVLWMLVGVVLFGIIMLLLYPNVSRAQESLVPHTFWCDLGEAETGNTTVASGSSVFKLHAGSSLQTPQSANVSSASGTSVFRGVAGLPSGVFTFQIQTLTLSQAQQGKAGNDASAVSPWYKVSLIDSAAAWAGAKKNYIFTQGSGVSLAGNSTWQVQIYPGWTENIQFGADTGATPFDVLKAKVTSR